jgi:predicted dehydrogenase
MDENGQIPVAVIGVGRMGRHHARIYHDLPLSQLLAVVDPDEDRAGALADQYQCDALGSIDALLDKYPQVRAVSVAAPTVYHQSTADRLVRQGIACLVEKPLAESVEVGKRIVETARDHQTLVQVGHTERFNPAVRAIRDWDITPRFIECDRVSPMTFRSIDVGVVFDMMIHDIDIVLSMVKSPLKEIRACGVSLMSDHEDVADARLEFEDGCVAKMTASRLALKTERKLRVFSESGYISLDYATKSGIAIQRTGNIEALLEIRTQLAEGRDLSDLAYTDLVNIHELTINEEEPLTAELTNFLEAVAGKAPPEVSVEAGFAAVDVAERVVAAITDHQWSGLDLNKLL